MFTENSCLKTPIISKIPYLYRIKFSISMPIEISNLHLLVWWWGYMHDWLARAPWSKTQGSAKSMFWTHLWAQMSEWRMCCPRCLCLWYRMVSTVAAHLKAALNNSEDFFFRAMLNIVIPNGCLYASEIKVNKTIFKYQANLKRLISQFQRFFPFWIFSMSIRVCFIPIN